METKADVSLHQPQAPRTGGRERGLATVVLRTQTLYSFFSQCKRISAVQINRDLAEESGENVKSTKQDQAEKHTVQKKQTAVKRRMCQRSSISRSEEHMRPVLSLSSLNQSRCSVPKTYGALSPRIPTTKLQVMVITFRQENR
eukprot:RCo021066